MLFWPHNTTQNNGLSFSISIFARFKTAVDSFGLISPFARFRIDYYPTTPSLPLTLHALTGQQSSSQTFHITSVWRVNFPFFFFCFLLLWRYTKVKVRIIFLSGKTQWASLGEKKQIPVEGYYSNGWEDAISQLMVTAVVTQIFFFFFLKQIFRNTWVWYLNFSIWGIFWEADSNLASDFVWRASKRAISDFQSPKTDSWYIYDGTVAHHNAPIWSYSQSYFKGRTLRNWRTHCHVKENQERWNSQQNPKPPKKRVEFPWKRLR